ncbi:MAG: tetratricopeptide repeat protein [Lysobacteraceae bacterium]
MTRLKSGAILLAVALLWPVAPTAAGEDPLEALMAGEFALQTGDLDAAAARFLAAARASDDPAMAERAAHVAVAAGDDARLAAAFSRWRALDPDAPGLHALSARHHLQRGRAEPALRALVELLDARGVDAVGTVLQALASAPQPTVAAQVLEGLLDRDALPPELQSWMAFGGLAQRLGDPALMERIVAATVERFPDEPRAWLLQAAQLRNLGRAEEAFEAIGRALEAAPEDTGLRTAAAGELERLGRGSDAARVLAEGPQDDALFATRAAYLARAGDREGLSALAAELELALDGGEARPAARLLLGQVSEYLGRFEQALGWYRSIPPGAGRARASLREARVLASMTRIDDAIGVLRELQLVESVDGESVRDAYLFEAELLQRDGRPVEALSAYGRGLDIFEDDPALLYARALAWAQADRVRAAEDDLRRLLAIEPDSPAVLNALGYTLADRTDRHEEALGYIRRALALDPDNPAIIDSMGWVLYRLGRHDEALEHLERAWRLLPDPEVGAHLGEVLWVVGERARARDIWEAARALDPDNPALLRALETFLP